MIVTFLARRLAPPAPAPNRHDPDLHALRGIAALIVCAFHLFNELPGMPFWVSYLFPGHAAVLLFFVLSGYVIGLVNTRPWSTTSVGDYWRRRLARLLPLYVLAVLFAFGVAYALGRPAGPGALIHHLLALQSFNCYGPFDLPPIWTNGALWSLNHELLYYTLFLVVWAWSPRVGALLSTCLLLAGLAIALPKGGVFFGAYATGFIFWLSGLALAWLAPSSPSPVPRRFPVLALLLLLAAGEHADTVKVGLAWLGYDLDRLSFVNLGDLALLAPCVLLVGGATRRLPRPGALPLFLCLAPPLATLAAALFTGHSLADPRWGYVAASTLIGACLLAGGAGARSLRHFAPLGDISYALYLFHQPIQALCQHALPAHAVIAAFLALVASLGAAWLLEKRLQPRLLSLLRLSPGR